MVRTFERYEKQVDEMLPQTAYRFVYETMPEEAVKAIEDCFNAGMCPERIADFLCEKYPLQNAQKKFFIKALEHHKFLFEVRTDKSSAQER